MTLRMIVLSISTLAGLCVAAISASAADTTTAGSLTIEHVWSRPTDAMATTGAIYFVIKNAGSTPDKLVGASTDAAGMAELHTNVNDAGMMRMRHIQGIDVPAKGSAVLEPGGNHVMLMDLKGQLKEGAKYPLTLTFEKAGKVTVQVQVERPDGSTTPMKGGKPEAMHDSMGGMK